MSRRRRYKNHRPINFRQINLDIPPQTQKEILIIFLFALSAISILGFFNLAGYAGKYIDNALSAIFGFDRLVLPAILIGIAFASLYPEKITLKAKNIIGLVMLLLSFNGLIQAAFFHQEIFNEIERGGGYIGAAVSAPMLSYFGFPATIISLASLLLISFILSFNTTLGVILAPFKFIMIIFKNLLTLIRDFRLRKRNNTVLENVAFNKAENIGFKVKGLGDEENQEPADMDKTGMRRIAETEEGARIAPLMSKRNYKKIDLPFSLLDSRHEKPSAGDISANCEKIKKTLENFNIAVEMGPIAIGPTVTQYTLRPSEGIRLSKIASLSNDLALSLAAHPIRIEAPIPGKSLVGIEVPNRSIATVHLREILDSQEFRQRKTNLSIALGKDVAGNIWIYDLGKMPHLLVAGTTGSGKTVSLISTIISLLYENSPEDLKFIMIDPKRVELPLFNGIPHLLTPVITHVPKIVNSLKWAILEMDRRFELLSKHNKRNIETFNREMGEKLPYIVIIIDELADLMAAASADVEGCIIRLAQMSRAVGIHLVIATQRPSVDVITGLIKANITARMAFAVSSMTDSRTIIDTSGAEKLLGHGDMLFVTSELSKPKRLQGAFVSDQEIKNIVDFLKQTDLPEYIDEITEKSGLSSGFMANANGFDIEDTGGDALLPDAKEVIVQAGKASASLLQRRLKVGYARAARLLDILENMGFIGPSDGAKPREILTLPEESGKFEEYEKIPTPDGEHEKYEELPEFPDEEDEQNGEEGLEEEEENGAK